MKRRYIIYAVLIAALLLVSLLCLCVGSTRIHLFGALFRQEGYETDSVILYSIRLPRLLSAIIAGCGLSVSGVLLQSVMANPLASPNTIGVNAGAGFTVILTLAFFPSFSALLPFIAFLGAFLTCLLIIFLSGIAYGGKSTVILAGIASNTLFQAGISFIASLDTDVLSVYNGFSLGSFSGVESVELLIPALFIAISFFVSILLSGKITALSLGDGIAASLGVRVRLLRSVVLMLASACAAAVVSYAGLLGFVGLVVPHIAKKLVGVELKAHLIVSALCGAILVSVSDLAARTLFSPSEISVGVVMAFVGAPFFLCLLLRRRGKYAGI